MVHTNRPTEWSNQDLGWSIPIFNIPATQAGMDRVLQRVVDSGSKLIITDFDWPSFQPTNPNNATAGRNDNGGLVGNVFGSAKHDLLMDRCANFGIYVVAGCQYTPDWAKTTSPGNNKVPPSRDKVNYADYCNFVRLVLDRYQVRTPDRIIAVSVWNEPNIKGFWQDPDNVNGPFVANYAKMLRAAYDTVKTGTVHAAGGDRLLTPHPEIMVGNGGMAPALGTGANGADYGWPQWVNGLIANGATNKFDLFFTHPYMWICNATLTNFTWNPMTYIQQCYTALKNAGRTDIFGWATEIGGGSRPDNSGTNPLTFDCATGGNGPNGSGGYDTGAPSPSYNTSSQAMTYSTSVTRTQQDIAEWRSAHFYDPDPLVNRQWSGPMFVWTLNDTAIPTDWAGANAQWQTHAGAYERGAGDGTTGNPKPHAATWIAAFTNTGGPRVGVPDTIKPDTFIHKVNGVDVTTPVSAPFPVGFATGAGVPTNEEMDAAKAFGAKFIRCGIPWDSGSTAPDRNFNRPANITAAIAYANSIKLDVILQIGNGPTYAGMMYTHSGPGAVDVIVEFTKFCANVVRAFTGVKNADGTRSANYVMAVEILNEANHAKVNDPFLSDNVTPNPYFIQWTGSGVTAPQRYMEIFLRVVHSDWENVRATANCPPIITTGLGGERDTKGINSFAFTQAIHQTVTFGGHTYTGGLWPTTTGAVPWYSGFDLHPYCYPTLPSQDVADGWNNMKQIMAWFQTNRGKKPPLWITEMGHPTNPENLANSLAARDTLADAINQLDGLILNSGWDIRSFAWFTLMDNNKQGQPASANDNHFGIVDRPTAGTDPQQGAHKPSPPIVPGGQGEYFNKFVEVATRTSAGATPTLTVADVVPIVIAASDNVAVARVDVLVDGLIIGQAAVVGTEYNFALDTKTLSNGSHQLSSRATDTSSNARTSNVVTIIVQNSTTPGGPSVTSVLPTTVPVAGGTLIAVRGVNLTNATVVEVGTVTSGWTACTNVRPTTWFPLQVNGLDLSGNGLSCVTPAHTAGTVHVRVTNPVGVSALIAADQITYVTTQTPGAPVVTRVRPNSGSLAGGETITVEGSAFTGATNVWFYPPVGARVAAASFAVTSDAGISVVVPGPEPGETYDVRVENAIGLSAVVPEDAYTFTGALSVALTGVNDGDVLTGVKLITVLLSNFPSGAGYGQGPYGQGPYGGTNNPNVQLLLDGVQLALIPTRVNSSGSPDSTGDYYQFALNTTTLANIAHTLRGSATTTSGVNALSPLITVTTANGIGGTDVIPPAVQILSPSSGGRVSGQNAIFSIQAIDDHDPVVPVVELWITETINIPLPPPGGAFELGLSSLGGPDPLGGGVGTGVVGKGWGIGGWGSGPWGGSTGSVTPPPGSVGTSTNPLRKIGVGVPDSTGRVFLVTWDTTTTPNGDYQVQALGIDSALNQAWSLPILITVLQPIVLPPRQQAPDVRYPWRVYVRDGATFRRVSGVNGFHSLDITARFNDVGVFTLIVPNVDPAIPFLVLPLAGIVVYYKDQIAFSGDITEKHRTYDQGDMWEFVGEDDNAFLRNRAAHPSPRESAPNALGQFSLQANDFQNAPAETLIWHYISVNVGPGATPNRKMPQLSLGTGSFFDQGRGTPIVAAPRFSNLLFDLQSIAASSAPKLGFRIIQAQDDNFPLRAEVYVPVDKSGSVLFAAQLGNLASFAYDIFAPLANVVYAAGKGSGTGRQFVQLEDTDSISLWRRRETLTDHTDAANLAELAGAAFTDAVQLISPPSISLEPRDTDNARYIEDYDLGDKVTFTLPEGTVFSDVVVEVAIRLDATGVLVKPAVGAGPQDTFAVFSETRRLSDAVRNLQTTRENALA